MVLEGESWAPRALLLHWLRPGGQGEVRGGAGFCATLHVILLVQLLELRT